MPSGTKTGSPEADTAFRKFRQFSPGKAVEILDQSSDQEQEFIKIWALARLLAWAILDQPGSPHRKTKVHRLQTKNARSVGHLTLARLLDRRLRRGNLTHVDTLGKLLTFFRLCGGFGLYLQVRGAKGLLSHAKGTNRDLGYVYRITAFLCRYKKYFDEDGKFSIDTAKRFVALDAHERDLTYDNSSISKIWEGYKHAAPYIFAFYRFFSSRLAQTRSPNQVVDFLEKLSSDQRRLSRLLGRAAYAADILGGRARGLRLEDFNHVTRVEPPLRPFANLEKQIIESIDRNEPIP